MGNDATSLWSGTGSATSLSVGSTSTDVCMTPQGPLSKGISFNIYISKQALNEFSGCSQLSKPYEPQCVTNSYLSSHEHEIYFNQHIYWTAVTM